VSGFRPRRTARRGDVQPDRHRQNERRRPASLAGGRPGPDRRASGAQDRRASTVELASALGSAQSGGLILAAIAAVFTIGYVANMLGEDDHWLHEFTIDMFAEDGCLHVYGVGNDGATTFTDYGLECM